MELHWDILDKKRKDILPLLKRFSDDGFYLAVGTGLALQLGHRDSIDFDFFKQGPFDTSKLVQQLESVFNAQTLTITQLEKDTVSCVVDDSIQLSFFGYPYDLENPLLASEYVSIASIKDIACMKISAITSRATEKDYVDLYFILSNLALKDILESCRKKFKSLDAFVILKSLTFFEDVEPEHILFKEGHHVSLQQLQKFFESTTNEYIRGEQLKSVQKKTRDKDIER
jgi:hypothetical protein